MTYLTVGQDLFSISTYLISQFNASLYDRPDLLSNHHSESTSHTKPVLADFFPAAFMVYTDLESLTGLDEPIDYGSGVQYADGILSMLGTDHGVGLQIGLWLNGTFGCSQVLRGEMDMQIHKLYQYIITSSAPKVFLRVGYEFDNPWFGYSQDPDTYVLAFQHVVHHLLSLDNHTHHHIRNKIQFVWHSWAAPTQTLNGNAALADSFQRFYPGDDYVDWVGVSIFQQVYPWFNDPVQASSSNETLIQMDGEGTSQDYTWAGSILYVENVLNFARLHNKPTMIAESTPFGGIHLENELTVSFNVTDPWDRWFSPILSLIEKYDIGMWSYIDCDWDSIPMWKGVGFGDTRISSDAQVMKKWRERVMRNPRFLLGNTMDLCSHEEDGPQEEIPSTILVIPSKNKHDAKDNTLIQSSTNRNSSHTSLIFIVTFVLFYIWFRQRNEPERRNREGTREETSPITRHV
jgi:hypothetical protein